MPNPNYVHIGSHMTLTKNDRCVKIHIVGYDF